MNPDKPVHAANVPTSTNRPRRQISHEQISEHARKLWRERGYPSGQYEAIWLEAESQLQSEAEAKPVAGTPAQPKMTEPAQPAPKQTKSRDASDTPATKPSATQTKVKPAPGKLRNQ
jgi:hypothetical protein